MTNPSPIISPSDNPFLPDNLVLENERVLLRPLQLDDLDRLLPYALHEPDTWKYSLINVVGREGLEQYIRETIRQRTEKKEFPFIIFDKASQTWAGSTRFYDIQPRNLSTQLGYTWLGEAFRRTGLNRHCKWLMLRYAFEQWGLERVEFRADARNEVSIKAMKGIGCTVEGILRSHAAIFSGGRRDSIILSILQSEWFGSVKERLREKCGY